MASPHRYAYGSPGGASHIPWGPRSGGAPGPPSSSSPTRAAQAYAPHLPHSHSPSRPQSQQQQQQHEQRSQHSSPVRATFDMSSSAPQHQQPQQFRPQMQLRIQTHAEPQWPHERYPAPGSTQQMQMQQQQHEYEAEAAAAAAADEQRYHVPSEFQEHRYAQQQQHQQQAHGMQYQRPHQQQQQHQQSWQEPQQGPPSHDNHAYVPFPSTSGAGDMGMYSYDRDRAYEQGVLPLETLGLEPPPPVSPERRERKGSGASARSLLASSPFAGLFKRGRKGSAAAAELQREQREREESGQGQGQGYFDASNPGISASQNGAHTPTSPSPLGAGGAYGDHGAGEREGGRGREKRASPGAAFFAAARNAARSFSPASPASWGRRSGGEMALAGGSGGGEDGNSGGGGGGRRSRKSSATRTPSPSSFVVHNVVKQPGGVSLDEYHASFGSGSENDQQQQQVGNSGYRREKSRPLGGGSGGSATGSGAGSLAAPPGGPGGGTGYGTARSGNDGRPETAIPAEFIMRQPNYPQQHHHQQRGRSGGGASVRSRDSREEDHDDDDDAARYDDERERSTSAAAAGEETMIVHHRPPSPGNISARAFRRNSTTFRSSSPSKLHSPVPPAAAAAGSRDGRDKPLPPPGRLSPVPPQQESHDNVVASPLQMQPPQPFAQPPSSQQQQQRRAMTGPRDSPFRQQSVPGPSIAAQHGLPEPIPIPAAAADDQRAGLGMGRQRRSSGGDDSEGRSPSGSGGGWRLRKGSGAGSSTAPDSPVGSSSPAGGRSAGLLSKILARENAANAQQHQQQQYGDVSLPDGASPRRGSRIASGASPAGLTGFLKGLLTPSTRAQDDSDDEGDFASPRVPYGAAAGGRRIVSPMPGRMGEETVLLDPSQLHAEAELQKRESVRQAQRIVDEERRRIMEAPTHGAHGHHASGGGRPAESQPWQPRQALDHDPAHAHHPHQGAHTAHRSRKAVPRMSEPGIPADEEARSREMLDDPLAELESKLTPAQR